jgi:hypothetical protein
VVVVAYEKDFATRLSRNQMNKPPRTDRDVRLTTVWNHAEAGIAYSLRLPLLLLCERGLRQEGMLEQNVLGFVAEIDLTEEYLSSPVFQTRLESWANAVREHADKPNNLLSVEQVASISISDLVALLRKMRLSTIWSIILALAALIAAAYNVGFWIGSVHK